MHFDDLLNQMLRSDPIPEHQWELAHDLMSRIDFNDPAHHLAMPYHYRACLRAEILNAMIGHGLILDHIPRTLWNMSLANYALNQWSERINHCQFSPTPQINALKITNELIATLTLIHQHAPQGFGAGPSPNHTSFVHKVLWNSLSDEYGSLVMRACLDLDMPVCDALLQVIDRMPDKPIMAQMIKGHLLQKEVMAAIESVPSAAKPKKM